MGMFSGAGGQGFDWGRAALSFLGAGPQLQQNDARRAQAAALALRQQEAEREQGLRSSLFNNLVKQGMDPGQAELAMSNPEAFGTEFNTRFRTREQGAAGGSTFTPNLNGQGGMTRMAPSRHEFQGSVFDVGGVDANGHGGAVTPRHQGVQVVPLQPGGELAGVNSFTGREVPLAGSALQQEAPPGSVIGQMTTLPGGPPLSAPRVGQGRASRYGGPDPLSILRAIPGVTFNSGRRTPEGNAAVGGVEGSNHLRGDSIDIGVGTSGLSLAQLAERARRLYGQSARVTPEPHRNHVHVDFPGYGAVPYHGERGARGAPQRQPVRVNSPEQARSLPPGTVFVTPDGRRKVR
jgi:hypothetical protein